jgi:hypothetical protein
MILRNRALLSNVYLRSGSCPRSIIARRRRVREHRGWRGEEGSPTTVYSDDWLRDQGGLEILVSREDLPTENGMAVGDL